MDAYYYRICHFIQKRPYQSSFLAACGGLYALYYLTRVVKRPQIVCGDQQLLLLISRHCPVAREYFWPTWWCVHPHTQTVLYSVRLSDPHIRYRREWLTLPDGGQVTLDWVDNHSNSPHPAHSRPTVLVLPGITGSSQDTYVQHLVNAVVNLGYRCVVYNKRGTGGCKLLTTRTSCAANTEDLEEVMRHIHSAIPHAPVLGLGVSLGGVFLLNYLAKLGEKCGMCAGMCISVIWDLKATNDSMENSVKMVLFNRYLAQLLIEKIKKHQHLFEDQVDMDKVLMSTSLREFDTNFTAKMFGFESCDHYYHEASPRHKIHRLRVPVLALSAADDPFLPRRAIPLKEAQNSNNLAIVLTARGGHIGFLEGTVPESMTYMCRWVSQYVHAVFSHWVEQ